MANSSEGNGVLWCNVQVNSMSVPPQCSHAMTLLVIPCCDVLLVFKFVLELSMDKLFHLYWPGTQSRLSNYTKLYSASHQDRDGGLMRTLVTAPFISCWWLFFVHTVSLLPCWETTCSWLANLIHPLVHLFNHLWVTDVLSAILDIGVYRKEGLNFAVLEAHTRGPAQDYGLHFSTRGTRIEPCPLIQGKNREQKTLNISERGQRLPETIKSEGTWYKTSGVAETSHEIQTKGAMWAPSLQKS